MSPLDHLAAARVHLAEAVKGHVGARPIDHATRFLMLADRALANAERRLVGLYAAERSVQEISDDA